MAGENRGHNTYLFPRNFFFQPFHVAPAYAFNFVTGGEEGFDLGVAEDSEAVDDDGGIADHRDYLFWFLATDPHRHTQTRAERRLSGNSSRVGLVEAVMGFHLEVTWAKIFPHCIRLQPFSMPYPGLQ